MTWCVVGTSWGANVGPRARGACDPKHVRHTIR